MCNNLWEINKLAINQYNMFLLKRSGNNKKELAKKIGLLSKDQSEQIYQNKIIDGLEIVNTVINKKITLSDKELKHLKKGDINEALFKELSLIIENWTYYKKLSFVFVERFEHELNMDGIIIRSRFDSPDGDDMYSLSFESGKVFSVVPTIRPSKIPLFGFLEYLFIFSLAEKPNFNLLVYKRKN